MNIWKTIKLEKGIYLSLRINKKICKNTKLIYIAKKKSAIKWLCAQNSDQLETYYLTEDSMSGF